MSVKELYEAFGGDYNRAIQTMMNDNFIMRMLTKFVQNNSYQDIIDSYNNKNYQGVFEASHSLKGVCGNLAITPIYEKASNLCEKTRNLAPNVAVDIDEEINELKETYNHVVSLINDIINN